MLCFSRPKKGKTYNSIPDSAVPERPMLGCAFGAVVQFADANGASIGSGSSFRSSRDRSVCLFLLGDRNCHDSVACHGEAYGDKRCELHCDRNILEYLLDFV